MLTIPEQTIYSAGALLCASVAAAFDIRERRIPNLLCGPSIVLGILLHGVLGGWGQAASSVLAGVLAGSAFTLFYFAGGMGAGDVKLITAVGCWIGLAPLGLTLLATATVGSLLALGLAIRRKQLHQTFANLGSILAHHSQEGLKPHPELNLNNPQALRLPFAVPIATGCLIAGCAVLWRG